MGVYCEYRGSFAGRSSRPDRDTDWLVELWREFDPAYAPDTVKALKFPADSPLTIEWEEWKPETALQGSMLTLKVESMTDREFINYYTNRVGRIYIIVYRREMNTRGTANSWAEAWRGALDPEFYEEPYETADGYTVSMTFSDFGALDRLDFDRKKLYEPNADCCSILHLIGAALTDARLYFNYQQWLYEHTPGSPYYVEPVRTWSALVGHRGGAVSIENLNDIFVPFGNFEDEEGTPVTWREAIEMCLAPLGLHVVQRAGRFTLYDTSWLCHDAETNKPPFIHWTADTQTLGTAETRNNVELTFSPYSRSEILSDTVEITNELTSGHWRTVCNYRQDMSGAEGNYNRFPSFRIATHTDGEGVTFKNNLRARYFKIKPSMGSASERNGIICNALPKGYGAGEANMSALPVLFRVESSPLPPPLNPSDNWLRLSFDMLFDPRYNPFEEWDPGISGCWNSDEITQHDWELNRWAAVPLQVRLLDNAGTPIYYYTNSAVFNKSRLLDRYPDRVEVGEWRPYVAHDGSDDCFAQWYNDAEDKPALSGWSTNRHTIGLWVGLDKLQGRYAKLPDGMLIPYPPCGGVLEIGIYDAVVLYKDKLLSDGSDGVVRNPDSRNTVPECQAMACKARWRMFSGFKVEIVKNNAPYEPVDADDIVREAEVVADTREPLTLTTKCGSSENPDASMFGLYRLGESRTAVRSMIRAQRYGSIEQILIGALFSQYEPRRVTLSGEAEERLMETLPVYRDHNMGDSVFIMRTSILDASAGTEDLCVVQVYPDTYGAEVVRDVLPEWSPDVSGEPGHDPGDNYPFEFDPGDYETPDPDDTDDRDMQEWNNDPDYWDDDRDND